MYIHHTLSSMYNKEQYIDKINYNIELLTLYPVTLTPLLLPELSKRTGFHANIRLLLPMIFSTWKSSGASGGQVAMETNRRVPGNSVLPDGIPLWKPETGINIFK